MTISAMWLGAVYTACLFLICVIVVHGIKLAIIGYRTLGKKLPPEPPKPKPRPAPPEPVYYIVERKKKRAKTEYTEPRRIQFK